MDENWKTIIWPQFGASIDMLENAMHACPDELWNDRTQQPEFWLLIYHTLFWLDFYLSEEAGPSFVPPAPFTLDEMDPDAVAERPYTKAELQNYLEHGREKCRSLIAGLDEQHAGEQIAIGSFEGSRIESLLYNLRHVQHHAAQLNLILRQQINSAPRWVRKTNRNLTGE
ncbi:MAG: DinB family protein [bacterium]